MRAREAQSVQVERRGPAWWAMAWVLLLVVAALSAPMLAREGGGLTGFGATQRTRAHVAPGAEGHLLGTDHLGHDVAAVLLHGAGTALLSAVAAAGAALLIGVPLGLMAGGLSGRVGGAVDWVVLRLIDVFASLPLLVVLVLGSAVLAGPAPVWALMLLLGACAWTGPARYVRGEVVRLRGSEMVLAARATGASGARVLWRHLLPHAGGPVAIDASLTMSGAVMLEATLSFLGLVSVDRASWGRLLAGAVRDDGGAVWWLLVFGGGAVLLTTMALHALGAWAAAALDPRRR